MYKVYNTTSTLYTGEFLVEGVFDTLFQAEHYLTRYSDVDKALFIIEKN